MVERIKAYCAERKCTIDEFERVLALSKNYVYKLDSNVPNAKTARKIAVVLGTSVEELLEPTQKGKTNG